MLQGVPHAILKDDEYNGMHIPGGSVVIPNIWNILHDESVFKDPFNFLPERHLPDPVTGQVDPDIAALHTAKVMFGFGRRACKLNFLNGFNQVVHTLPGPGTQIGTAQFRIYVARILQCFKIDYAQDANGNKIVPKPQWSSGLVRSVALFRFPAHLV